MSTLCSAVLAVAVCGLATAQDPRADWLRDHAIPLHTIDIADDDLSDLAPLTERIGDARIVGLGEPTHGDGAHFCAKARLVRFLHERMGFDVLVWESGMFDCSRVEAALRAGEPLATAWSKGIFAVWAASAQVRPLFDYVQRTRASGRPLEIAGMDAQLTGRDTPEALRSWLRELCAKAAGDPAVAAAFDVIDPAFERIRWTPLPGLTADERDGFRAALQTILTALRDDAGPFRGLDGRDRSFATRALINYDVMVEMIYWAERSRQPDADPGDQLRYAEAREIAMADTLVWLARERYPDRKLIVWAASSHLTWNSRRVEWQDDDGGWKFDDTAWEPMGNRTKAALGDELYVIDCIAHAGKLGSVAGWKRDLEPPPPGSIDALCHETGHPFLFVDLRTLPDRDGGAWLRERLVARPRGYAPMRADWSEICDAFLFTDAMFPSTLVQKKDD